MYAREDDPLGTKVMYVHFTHIVRSTLEYRKYSFYD